MLPEKSFEEEKKKQKNVNSSKSSLGSKKFSIFSIVANLLLIVSILFIIMIYNFADDDDKVEVKKKIVDFFLSLILNWIVFPVIIALSLLFFFPVKTVKGLFSNLKGKISEFSGVENNIARTNITFKDIGGLYEAKSDLEEVIFFYKNYDFFIKKGVKKPKGILLEGPPGNGKTLLAKALSNECDVPFFLFAGTEFEGFLYVEGSLKTKELFKKAREMPNGCIIFIDEFDCIARNRSTRVGNSVSQTINQFLIEMDGFENNDKILVLASTNLKHMLDPAILRPGRFDRTIFVGFPDYRSRKEIIEIYIKKTSGFFFDVDINDIADITFGLSGAAITNVINESALYAIKKKSDVINIETIVKTLGRVVFGIYENDDKTDNNTEEEKKIKAVHEAGHTLLALTMPNTFVRWVTVSATSSGGVGGYTMVSHKKTNSDVSFLNKKDVLSRIKINLGGRIAEEIFLGKENVTNGASNDFKKASLWIKKYIFEYSMSDLGMVPFEKEGEEIKAETEISQKSMEEIESVKKHILETCFAEAKRILLKNKKLLSNIVDSIIKFERLNRQQINYIYISKLPLHLKLLN